MIEETVLAEQDPAEQQIKPLVLRLSPRTVRQPNYQFCGRRYPIRKKTCQRLAL